MNNLKKVDYLYLAPLILLLWGVFSLIFIPIIPIASGFGWDGVFYGKVGLDFKNMIGEIDTYHAGRIFPGVFIHYFFLLFKIPLTIKYVLLAYKIYYLIILTASALIWVRIAKLSKLNPINGWIGFIAVFISYPVLNWYFYYPALTDGTTLFIGLLLISCYLKQNNFLLLLAVIVSFFSWPTGIIMCFSIFLYGKEENVYWGYGKHGLKRFITILLLLSPLFLLVIACANLRTITSLTIELGLKGRLFDKLASFNKGIEYNWVALLSSTLIISYFLFIYWNILKDFNFKRFFLLHLQKGMLLRIFIIAFVFVIMAIIKKGLSNPLLPTVTAFSGYAYPVISQSTRFPLQFIISHVAFWGPCIFLFIFFFKRFVQYLKTTNLAIMVGFILTMIFSINAESRAITNFYPFIVFILVQIVDFSKLKYSKPFALFFLLISFVYSKIWLLISLPPSTYPNASSANLDKFPMQWYFMNFGLWMNYDMYLLHLLSIIILGSVTYFTIKPHKVTNINLN